MSNIKKLIELGEELPAMDLDDILSNPPDYCDIRDEWFELTVALQAALPELKELVKEYPKVKLYFDGSCGPTNPGGHACYGFVLICDDKELYRKSGVALSGDGATNNVAEFFGLINGLECLIDNGETGDIEIYGDSKLVVMQVDGQWKCNQPHLQELLKRTQGLLEHFNNWTINWIPRNENSIADGLSKWQKVLENAN